MNQSYDKEGVFRDMLKKLWEEHFQHFANVATFVA